MFRVDSDIGIITLISEEWRDTSGSLQSVVESELHKR
jgi:hypothetical protein